MKRIALAIALILSSALAAMGYVTVPQVVFHKEYLNQTGAIPPTVLFTPSSDNNFRLNVYIAVSNCAGGNGGGDVNIFTTWNDSVASNTFSPVLAFCGVNGATTFGEGSQILHVAAGTPISFYTGNNAGSSYNLYITLERL
jgi:hypothetical protein